MTTRKKSGVPRGTSSRRKTKKKTKATKAAPSKKGRPTKYHPRYCNDLVEHMRRGGSIQGFGGYLYEKYVSERDPEGIIEGWRDIPSEKTVHTWFKAHKDFLQSKEIGLPLSRKFWDELTQRGTAGALRRVTKEEFDANGKVTKREYAPATFGQSFAIFTYKNRFGWRDRVEHSGEIGQTADKTTGKAIDSLLTDPATAEAALKIAEAMAARATDEAE